MLAELKQHLMQSKVSNLKDLSARLSVDPTVVRHMLNVWIGKGRIKKVECSSGCMTQCQKCNPLTTEFYQWIG